jgi:ribonuclease Z
MIWIRRLIIGLAALALLTFAGFNIFTRPIASWAFNRAVERDAGVDRSASLPDGLHVYICGSGSPMPDASRAGPCVGVLAGDRAYVFDAGTGGARNLGSMGFPIGRIDRVFLTHLHSDHIDGLGELLLLSWIAGSRTTATPVHGPVGTEKVVSGFNTAYQIDSTYRVDHHGTAVANPNGFGGSAQEIEMPKGPTEKRIVFEDANLRIVALRVNHSPIEPAFGYRIDYKGRSVSLSGDTVFHPGFVAASKGVDLMMHEALNKEMLSKIATKLGERGNPNGQKIFADIVNYHTTPDDAARAAQDAGADQLVLYHIVPPLPAALLESLFIGDARSKFDGKITVARDGVIFSLPAGSDNIKKTRGF